MGTRAYVVAALRSAFAALNLPAKVFPVIQSTGARAGAPGEPESPLDLPAVIYSTLPGSSISLLTGPFEVSERWRLDVRSDTAKESERLDRAVITALREGGRLRTLGGPTEDYDEGLSLYRRLRVVEIGT